MLGILKGHHSFISMKILQHRKLMRDDSKQYKMAPYHYIKYVLYKCFWFAATNHTLLASA